MTRTEIVVRGPLAATSEALIASRFDALSITPVVGSDTAIAGELDQAAERSLLALLWDTGHEVVSMRSIPTTGGDDE